MTACIAPTLAAWFVALCLGFTPLIAFADDGQPDHDSMKPYKPYSFSSQWEIENFRNEVEEYKRCIAEFVEEQQDAIRNHTQAADDAIDEWNSFVRIELN